MNYTVTKLMSQAQVFASAWALVGGRFDRGGCLDDAEEAKSELKTMIEEALAPPPDCRTCAAYHPNAGCTDVYICVNGNRYKQAPFVVLWRTE